MLKSRDALVKGVNIQNCHTNVYGKNLYANFEEDHPVTLGSPMTVQSEGKDRIESATWQSWATKDITEKHIFGLGNS